MQVAERAEELGFQRVWYAEHHSSPMLMDFPPAVVIAHVAAVTSSIRVGSGGVMAPNHAPLSVAEQFAALAAIHPGRVDLGIGRGPGTMDQLAARALRWGAPAATQEEYAQSVREILSLAGSRDEVPEPWLLSSSAAGAALAAELGLPMAFGSHLRPGNTAEAVDPVPGRLPALSVERGPPASCCASGPSARRPRRRSPACAAPPISSGSAFSAGNGSSQCSARRRPQTVR